MEKLDRVEAIDKDRVAHVALLSRLALTDEEIEQFAGELTKVVGHLNKLAELDLDDVPMTSHAIPMSNVFRPDAARPGLPTAEALANAPEQEDDCFKVPQII
ncbi:MAG: Asp-tRNA(Asn)/Glu-tRNA(Gln) amidotransferase subunit GatC [Sumerlaeia bacterium]